METIILSIINNPKDGLTLAAILAIFIWCLYNFGIIKQQIKAIIDTQTKDNENVIKKLDELKEDISNLADKLFEYVRSQQK